MATVSEVLTTPLSGLQHIDALLDKGPDWNYLTGTANTIFYTFSIASGNESGKTGQEAFSASQQAAARSAFSYLQQVTGISFVETSSGADAHIHLCNIDIADYRTTGLCSWTSPYSYTGTALNEYNVDAWIYLDNAEFRAQNQNLVPGGDGYETLLHEMGHALGLKHPFETEPENSTVLPSAEDNTGNTLLSYNAAGSAHSTFSPYDIAALNWLYGGDGLRGALGINSSTGARYLTGTNRADTLTGTRYDDTLQGNGGNDMIDGGEGKDTMVFSGSRGAYTFVNQADGALQVSSSAEGVDTLRSVEQLTFADMTVQRSDVVDTTAPVAPTFVVTHNQFNYARGSKPGMTGAAEAGSTVKVYSGSTLIATVVADQNGLWKAESSIDFPDGLNYSVHATATDGAGNVSAPSATVTFNIDATAPTIPTGSVNLTAGDNRPVFSGTGEVGTTVQLYVVNDTTVQRFGSATVGADGTWSHTAAPLPNGNFDVSVVSKDLADNSTAASSYLQVAVANAGYRTGTAGKDVFTMGDGSTAVAGGTGTDVAVFSGNKANYTVAKDAWGYVVTDNVGGGGTDRVIGVERLQFADGWKAIDDDGVAGQIFRLYQAVFDRAPDIGGMGYWIQRMESGTDLMRMANEFMTIKAPDGTVEFETLYGKNLTDEQFVVELYDNVLNREPDAGGKAYWIDVIKHHSRAQILMAFSESPENQGNVIDLVAKGMDYIPFG